LEDNQERMVICSSGSPFCGYVGNGYRYMCPDCFERIRRFDDVSVVFRRMMIGARYQMNQKAKLK
jgi:hypothetical protein